MNYRFVLRQFGLLMFVLSACLAAITVAEWCHVKWFLKLVPEVGDSVGGGGGGGGPDWSSTLALGWSTLIGLAAGGLFWLFGRGGSGQQLHRREAFLLTGLTWLIGGLLAAMPFWLWAIISGDLNDGPTKAFSVPGVNRLGYEYWVEPGHEFTSFMSCYFEAVSGLTTTGGTVLGERGTIEGLPWGILLWRSTTHWLGGLGIVVLFVAVLPSLGVGAKRLFASESSVQESGVRPRIGETARTLWLIYLGLTVLCTLLYVVGGMSWFDAVNHAFSALSTGGYSTRNGSIGDYDSLWIDINTTFFMLLAGMNFIVFYRLARRKWREAFGDVELRWYLILKVVGTVIVAFNLWGTRFVTTASHGNNVVEHASFGEAWRFASFQVASLQTGTGFGTADYDTWPYLSRAVLFSVLLIGGCAGSTAGGIKVIRFVLVFKVFGQALERAFRPSVVRPLKVGGQVVEESAKLAVTTFVLLFVLVWALGFLSLQLLEPSLAEGGRIDFITSVTASLSCLCNVGPGMLEVGATKHFGWFTSSSKAVLCFLMVLGRLELFALLVLFTPRFWKPD